MPNFSYTAKSAQGQIKSGVMEALDSNDLAKILYKEGYVLVKSDISDEQGEKEAKKRFSLPFFGKVSLAEKLMFTRNLKVMVKAGISLPKALRTLSLQAKSKKLKSILLQMANQITEGKTFSDSLYQHPAIFSELYCSMVKIGEEAGTLEEVLDTLANHMERDYELRSKIKGALIYPAVIISAMFLIGVVMLIFVVPKLAQTFAELKIQLPLTTRFVIGLGNFLAAFWYLIPFIIGGFVLLFRALAKTKTGKKIIDSLTLKIPLISPIVKKSNSASTTRTLSSLISAGVPIVRAMEILADTMGNSFYKNAILESLEELKKGVKLSQSLSKYPKLFPVLVVQMIEVGEETGETSEILKTLAEFYEEEVSRTAKNLSTVIEPILMLIIGAVIGFFAVSMIQPMYSMIQAM